MFHRRGTSIWHCFPQHVHCLLHLYFCGTYQVLIVQRWMAILISHSHCYLSITDTFPAIIHSRLGQQLHVYEPLLNILILSMLQVTLTWNVSFFPCILSVCDIPKPFLPPRFCRLSNLQWKYTKQKKAYLLKKGFCM